MPLSRPWKTIEVDSLLTTPLPLARPAAAALTPARVALAHGTFLVVCGLWPVVHMPSFEAVTGRKREHWLVRTVGLLLATIGVAVTRGRERSRVERSAAAAGVGTALVCAAIDVVYASRGRIARVYLIDAVAQAGFAAAWGAALARAQTPTPAGVGATLGGA